MNNYLIEPCEQNWYNRVIIYDKHYNLDGSFSDFALIEDYNTISYNTNREMMKKVFEIELRKYNNNSASTPSSINLKELYIIKFNDYYIYKLCSKSLSESIINIKPVSNPFFSITYTDNKYYFSIELDLPKSIFISGNEILSCAFIKRWFDYSIMDSIFQFHNHYIIEMTDDNFEEVSIDSNKYILLTDVISNSPRLLGNNLFAIFTIVKFRIREFVYEYNYSILAPLISNLLFVIIFLPILKKDLIVCY